MWFQLFFCNRVLFIHFEQESSCERVKKLKKRQQLHFLVTWRVTPKASSINVLLSLCLISQGKHRGKGTSDGSHNYKQLFSCDPLCGVFVPFSQIKAVAHDSSSSPTTQPLAPPNSEELFVGDRVTYFTPNELRHGMVMDIQEKDGQTMVRVSTVSSFPNRNKNKRAFFAKFTQGGHGCLSFLFTGHRWKRNDGRWNRSVAQPAC